MQQSNDTQARALSNTMYLKTESERVLQRIKGMIEKSNINDNSFYRTFRTTRLPQPVLKQVFQQYFYYIRTFPQILAGTSHLVTNEVIRMQLARTVVSELGDGIGVPHFMMFENVLSAVGVTLDDWKQYKYIPEAAQLVDGLRHIFLQMSPEHAIGAHYVIEEFGYPMIVNLYEGFRQYAGWKHEDYAYFYLHMLVESDHVAWITAAVTEACGTRESQQRLEEGAAEVLKLLMNFWNGLDRLSKQA